MKTTRRVLAALLALGCCAPAAAQEAVVCVANDLPVQRQEVVGLDAREVYARLGTAWGSPLVVTDAGGQEVGCQLSHDGQLLLDVSVRPCGETRLTVRPGVPKPAPARVAGRQYPERADDLAWENDRCAYRVYGPALQRSGERSFGIDIWLKNTPDLQVEQRYRTELGGYALIDSLNKAGRSEEARQAWLSTSYHIDHGYGMDCYKVGPTLGCGAPALLVDGQLRLPYCYQECRVLDNGPLRFTAELTYGPQDLGKAGRDVVEHRLISLDKGSHFNRMTVWYTGLRRPVGLVAGVVVHPEDTASVVLGADYVHYADPTDNPQAHNFQIYVAALFPQGVSRTALIPPADSSDGYAGHAAGVVERYRDSDRYTYYFGSAWSQADVRSQRQWQTCIDDFMDALRSPLRVRLEGE